MGIVRSFRYRWFDLWNQQLLKHFLWSTYADIGRPFSSYPTESFTGPRTWRAVPSRRVADRGMNENTASGSEHGPSGQPLGDESYLKQVAKVKASTAVCCLLSFCCCSSTKAFCPVTRRNNPKAGLILPSVTVRSAQRTEFQSKQNTADFE